jgi:Protein of unknown function (DUF5818)
MERRSPLEGRRSCDVDRDETELAALFFEIHLVFRRFFMSFRHTVGWVGLVVLTPFVWSQQPQLHREIPEDAFGTRELIVWSGVERPQPMPQPLPAPDRQPPQPGQQSKPSADPQAQPTLAQSFSGWIVRDGDRYALRAAGNTTYQLDEQTGVQQYENKNVYIVGKLVAASNTIHVVKIELVS